MVNILDDIFNKKSLRYIKGKRETFIAEKNGVKFIFKGFYKKSLKYFLQEVNIHSSLSSEFNLPKIINISEQNKKFTGGLIQYEFLSYPTLTDTFKDNKNYLNLFIKEIGKLNSLGYFHTDPHFDNFLVHKDKLYFIDLSSIKKEKNNSKLKHNIAFGLAQIDLSYFEMIRIFVKENNINFSKIEQYKKEQKNRFFKKLLRNSSNFKKEFTNKGYSISKINLESYSKNSFEINFHSSILSNNAIKLWQSLNWLFLSKVSNLEPISIFIDKVSLTSVKARIVVSKPQEKPLITFKNSFLKPAEIKLIKENIKSL